MNCCDANGDCQQGRDCPVRKCRQRAGQPAKYDEEIWLGKTAEEIEDALEKQWKSELKSIVFIASCILSFFIIVLVTTK